MWAWWWYWEIWIIWYDTDLVWHDLVKTFIGDNWWKRCHSSYHFDYHHLPWNVHFKWNNMCKTNNKDLLTYRQNQNRSAAAPANQTIEISSLLSLDRTTLCLTLTWLMVMVNDNGNWRRIFNCHHSHKCQPVLFLTTSSVSIVSLSPGGFPNTLSPSLHEISKIDLKYLYLDGKRKCQQEKGTKRACGWSWRRGREVQVPLSNA